MNTVENEGAQDRAMQLSTQLERRTAIPMRAISRRDAVRLGALVHNQATSLGMAR